MQSSSSTAHSSEAEQEAAAELAPTSLAKRVDCRHGEAVLTAELQVVSSSSHDKAVKVSSSEGSRKVSDTTTACNNPTSSSAAESAAAVNALDRFLHTVTTADEVLNELLGDLSRSSSSSSAALMCRPSSSSALPDLASTEDADVSAAQLQPSSSSVLTADAAVQSSVPEQELADGIHTFSSALGPSHMSDSVLHSPRTPTDLALDTLLEDLRSAELARQSSSSILLSKLNSLAEMRRCSASSSPVAGSSSQADAWRHASSSPAAADPHPAADPRFAEDSHAAADPISAYLRLQSSSTEVAEASKGIRPGQHCSSSSIVPEATALVAQQDPCLSSSGSAAGEEDDQNLAMVAAEEADCSYLAAVAAEEEECSYLAAVAAEEEEWVGKGLQRLSTADLVLEVLLEGAELTSEVALEPSRNANEVCTSFVLPNCMRVQGLGR